MVIYTHAFRSGFILSVILLLWFLASPSWAEVKCGDTIGPNAVATLTQDLFCAEGTGSTALILEASSRLDLGGHTIICTGLDGANIGIQMNGHGSILRNGTLGGCATTVVVGGTGGHRVSHVTVNGNFAFLLEGFKVESSGNVLISNTAENITQVPGLGAFGGCGFCVSGHGNVLVGNTGQFTWFSFLVTGNDNRLVNNRSLGSPGQISTLIGMWVFGSGNRLFSNHIEGMTGQIGDGGNGIVIDGDASENVVGKNTSSNNNTDGILVSEGALNNRIYKNVAQANGGQDLVDQNQDCDNNLWRKNEFETSNQACIQ